MSSRPTFNPAVGGAHGPGVDVGGYFTGGALSSTRSVRNQAGFLTMKKRGRGQINDVSTKDLRAELEARERAHFLQQKKEAERKLGLGAVDSSLLSIGDSMNDNKNGATVSNSGSVTAATGDGETMA